MIGRFTSGVTVITTAVDGEPVRHHGQRVQLAVDGAADGPDLPEQDQRDTGGGDEGRRVPSSTSSRRPSRYLAYRFARKGDKFADLDPRRRTATASPCCRERSRASSAEVGETVTGGTHTVFLAHVDRRSRTRRHAVDLLPGPVRPARERPRGGGLPGGAWLRAGPAPARWTDRWSRRRWPRCSGIDPGHVTYALVRLAGENVVRRTADGRYIPTPLTVELADELLQAPLPHRARSRDDGRAHRRRRPDVLAGYAHTAGRDRRRGQASLTEFLEASHGYHRHFVGLGAARSSSTPTGGWGSRRCGGAPSPSTTGARGSTSPTTPS